MDTVSIKVSIAGRSYPLTVKKTETDDVTKASKMIAERMSEYEGKYTVRDKQDLLAMCALQIATRNAQLEKKSIQGEEQLSEQLEEMETFLSGYLKKV